MNLRDDLKAINNDISNTYSVEEMTNRAFYWLTKLSSIYPDIKFTVLTADAFDYKIVAGGYSYLD